MGAEEVVEKILADARSEAENIKKQAEQKQAQEQARLAEQLKEYKKETEALAQKAANDRKLHILAAARMENAKQLLAEKKQILDEIFEKAKQRIKSLPDDEYRRLMANLLLKAVETGSEEVVIGKNENRIDQNLINQVNNELNKDNKGNLKLSGQKQDMTGGFVLKRGKIKVNASIDVLLNQAREELEIELAQELFVYSES